MSEENKNIEEEQPENIPATGPRREEITSSEQTDIPGSDEQSLDLNPLNDLTDTMDTHADHLHKAPGHGWKHYFFEFLMLFLAITLGFFVENQREHYVEHQREKKFSRQLLADLRADSASLTRLIKGMRTGLENHKKLTALMTSPTSPSNRDVVSTCINLYIVYSSATNDATYTQMKSSGSLRYIQNDDLTTLLQNYYEVSRRYMKTWEEMEIDFYRTQIQPYCINHFMMADIDFLNDTLINQTPVFLNRTPESEIQLLNIMATYESYVRVHMEKGALPAEKKLHAIINMLKEEYHLE